jgi:hypothetical protein
MRRLAAVLSLAAAATLFTATPALAKPTPPAPPSTATFCPAEVQQPVVQPDGSVVFGVEANGAGCVVVQGTAQGITLNEVVAAPGWTWTSKNGGGGSRAKVDIQFHQTATGSQVEVRVEPGRTEVR